MLRQLGFFVYAVVLVVLLWGFVNLLPKEADKPTSVAAPTTSPCDRITEASPHWKAQASVYGHNTQIDPLELTKLECKLNDMGVR